MIFGIPSLLLYAFLNVSYSLIICIGNFLNPLSFCSLTFCSLSENKITSDGVHELAKAMQVNQSLQKLKWAKPLKFFFLRGVHWDFSVINRPVLILANTAKYIWHYQTKWRGFVEPPLICFWLSVASMETRSQLKEPIHWLRLYRWTRVFRN